MHILHIKRTLCTNACTSSTLRELYARICVQIPLETILRTSILIESHHQQIQYEGEGFLCKSCGCLGHTATGCILKLKVTHPTNGQSPEKEQTSPGLEQEWQTTTFKRGNRRKYTVNETNMRKENPGKSSSLTKPQIETNASPPEVSGSSKGKAPIRMLQSDLGRPNTQVERYSFRAKNIKSPINVPINQQPIHGKDSSKKNPHPNTESLIKSKLVSPNTQPNETLVESQSGTKNETTSSSNKEDLLEKKKSLHTSKFGTRYFH